MRRFVRLGLAAVEPDAGQLVVVVVEYPAAVPDDPEGLRESEKAVEGVRAATEDQILFV